MIKQLKDIYEVLTESVNLCGEDESVKNLESYLQDEGEEIPDTLEEMGYNLDSDY